MSLHARDPTRTWFLFTYPPDGVEVEDEISDDDLDDRHENDIKCPTIKLSKNEKCSLCNRWKNALIKKLIDHTVGYQYLVRRIKTLWQIKSHINVIDVGFGAYVVRFIDMGERERALYGDHGLLLITI